MTDTCGCPKYTNEYLYDLDGTVCGIKHNGTAYYFYKNLQGDVIAITDANGATVAQYTYDAWGVCTIVSDVSGVDIANINPFRYRGYYYDADTSLYYLQSRYYNPVVGRFINEDTTDSLQNSGNLLENNLFVYCQNDPINETDDAGTLFTSVIKKILIGVFKRFIGLLGSDFISYFYKILFVDSNAAFKTSDGSDYLKSILSAVAAELIDFLGGIRIIAQVFMIVGPYFTKLIKGKMGAVDWVALVLKLALLILKTVLAKKLDEQKAIELKKIKKLKKEKVKEHTV